MGVFFSSPSTRFWIVQVHARVCITSVGTNVFLLRWVFTFLLGKLRGDKCYL